MTTPSSIFRQNGERSEGAMAAFQVVQGDQMPTDKNDAMGFETKTSALKSHRPAQRQR
jgi:hypothetical protein